MNQVIRILAYIKRVRDFNLRYKIAYRRAIYNGYDVQNGDEVDQAIYDYFNQKETTKIGWEYIGIDTGDLNLTNILNTFTPRNIPLIIWPSLDGLSAMELDNLQVNKTTFPTQNRLVTLFYRSNMDNTHENWEWLPTQIRININYKRCIQLAQTIFPFQ
jgi:hypothetical protein